MGTAPRITLSLSLPMRSTDDFSDARADDAAYRQWQQDQRDDTPIEYWYRLDLSRQAYAASMAEEEDA